MLHWLLHLFNLTDVIVSVTFKNDKSVGVEVAWTMEFCFCVVTHDWMSSLFDMLFLLWLVVMCLLSSLDEIVVRVELLANDVWEADDYKPGFLSVWVDIFDISFINDQSSCPW